MTLRILRRVSGGGLKFVASSATQTVTQPGQGTFSAHVGVQAGDVLALTHASSGLYMGQPSSNASVRYFLTSVSDGWSGRRT